jgi:CelD/BcsL family acetyltransferase involved in cellulose biosynthesis
LLLDPKYPEAIPAMARMIERDPRVACYTNEDLASTDDATLELLDALQKGGASVRRTERRPFRWIRFESSYGDYLARHKSPTSRKGIRRHQRRLEDRKSVGFDYYRGGAIDEAVIDRLAVIQQRSWMKRRGVANLADSKVRVMVQRMAKADFACAWIMTLNGQDAAFQYATISGNRATLRFTAFDLRFADLRVGKLLVHRVLDSLCDLGIANVDFGHGDSDDKRFWCNELGRIDRVSVGQKGIGKLLAGSFHAFWIARRRASRMTWVSRVRTRLRAFRSRGIGRALPAHPR